MFICFYGWCYILSLRIFYIYLMLILYYVKIMFICLLGWYYVFSFGIFNIYLMYVLYYVKIILYVCWVYGIYWDSFWN